jgi:hypothetical protein
VFRVSGLNPSWNSTLVFIPRLATNHIRKESKVKHSLAIVVMCSLALAKSAVGSAHIYLDEDFEGTTVFTDRDWPIRDTSTIPTPSIVGVKGVNLRSWDSSAGETAPKPSRSLATPARLCRRGTTRVAGVFSWHRGSQLESRPRYPIREGM